MARFTIACTDQEHDELHRLAARCRTSVSALGHLAVSQLLLSARNGALPMLPASTLENAELAEERHLFSVQL